MRKDTIELLKDQKVSKVTVSKPESYGAGEHHIVLVDYGTKKSILNSLVKRDCKVTVVPYHTSFEEIQEFKTRWNSTFKWTWGSKRLASYYCQLLKN